MPTWVKATDKTPQHYGRVCCRLIVKSDDQQYWFTGYWDFSRKAFMGLNNDAHPANRVEWLDDETPTVDNNGATYWKERCEAAEEKLIKNDEIINNIVAELRKVELFIYDESVYPDPGQIIGEMGAIASEAIKYYLEEMEVDKEPQEKGWVIVGENVEIAKGAQLPIVFLIPEQNPENGKDYWILITGQVDNDGRIYELPYSDYSGYNYSDAKYWKSLRNIPQPPKQEP